MPRFVPSAGLTIEVPCPEPVAVEPKVPAVPAVKPADAAPATGNAEPDDAMDAPEEPAVPAATVPQQDASVKPPAKPVHATAIPTKITGKGRNAKRCVEILDRVQNSQIAAIDIAFLRTGCRIGS